MNRQVNLNQQMLVGKNAREQKVIKEFANCAQQLSALAEPLRLMIVMALMDGRASVSELAERLGVEIFTISHHLRILKNSGLVAASRLGRHAMYSLAPGVGIPANGKAPTAITLNCCTLVLGNLG